MNNPSPLQGGTMRRRAVWWWLPAAVGIVILAAAGTAVITTAGGSSDRRPASQAVKTTRNSRHKPKQAIPQGHSLKGCPEAHVRLPPRAVGGLLLGAGPG